MDGGETKGTRCSASCSLFTLLVVCKHVSLSYLFFLLFFFQDWSGGVNRGHVSLKNYG